MRKILFTGLLLFIFLIGEAEAGDMQRYIVTIKGPAEQAVFRAGGIVDHVFELIPAIAIRVPEPALEGLSHHPAVVSIEPDVPVQAVAKPPWAGGGEEEQMPQVLEWGVDRVDADLVWTIPVTGLGIKVSVIDTGIDKDHPDLTANIKGGINFVPKGQKVDSNAWDDDNGHGTHVAGIVGAVNNEIGVIGVAPEAGLYAVKVLDRQGRGYLSDVIAGIEWSVNNGIQVANMSLGTATHVDVFEAACDAAEAAGVLLVAAAGNSGDGDGTTNEVIYPAKYSSVIAVAATAKDDSTPTWSSEGEEVELAAPGVDIRSTWKGGGYKTISGTSMASPHVAGTAALLLETVSLEYDYDGDGTWAPMELRACLIDAADDMGPEGFDNYYGHGMVDAEESVTGTETNP